MHVHDLFWHLRTTRGAEGIPQPQQRFRRIVSTRYRYRRNSRPNSISRGERGEHYAMGVLCHSHTYVGLSLRKRSCARADPQDQLIPTSGPQTTMVLVTEKQLINDPMQTTAWTPYNSGGRSPRMYDPKTKGQLDCGVIYPRQKCQRAQHCWIVVQGA